MKVLLRALVVVAGLMGSPTQASDLEDLKAEVDRIYQESEMIHLLDEAQRLYDAGKHSEAIELLRTAADQGDAEAQVKLGAMYGLGVGIPKDYKTAVILYRRAADQGWASAQHNLGVMYHEGLGVPQDYKAAVNWYLKAAHQDFSGAQVNLGTMYARGFGVPEDLVQAHMWANLASASAMDEESRDIAIKNRDIYAAKMTPAQTAEAQALAVAWKPKANGSGQ